jgi:hypothetical protein
MDGVRCPLASGWSEKDADSMGYNPAMRFAKGAGFSGHKNLSRTKSRREFFSLPAGAAKKFQRAEATTAPRGSEKRSNGLALGMVARAGVKLASNIKSLAQMNKSPHVGRATNCRELQAKPMVSVR